MMYMTQKAENTRASILDSAMNRFLKEGFSGASLRAILQDVGLTTGAFYKYFPGREALFDALVDPYVEHIYEIYDRILDEFQQKTPDEQTQSMADTSARGMDQMIDYVYDNYDHFRLLRLCGDTGKYEDFIHNMVEREISSTRKYLADLKASGVSVNEVSDGVMHMIYTGFFSSVFQIIEHDIDRDTAKENVDQLRTFQTGGWERLWNVKFDETPES